MNAKIASVALAAFALTAPAISSADTTVQQLTYNFTYSANQTTTARDSANPAEDYSVPANQGTTQAYVGTNGSGSYGGSLSDKGTMTVTILAKQQDGGLIVTIAENGQAVRRAPAATCVVYGNTKVICDPNKTVYTEEYTLLRFMGQNFIDASNLDAHRHWQIVQSAPSRNVTADYTLGPRPAATCRSTKSGTSSSGGR